MSVARPVLFILEGVETRTPPKLEYGSPSIPPTWSLTRVIAWMCVYPLLTAAFLYGTWLTAAIMLGHAPGVYVDDPSGIHWITHGMQIASVLLLFMGMPLMLLHVLLAIRATLWSLTSDGRRDWHRLGWGLTGIMVWAGFWVLVTWDPGRVTDWLMD